MLQCIGPIQSADLLPENGFQSVNAGFICITELLSLEVVFAMVKQKTRKVREG
jgi:hypothetical protein